MLLPGERGGALALAHPFAVLFEQIGLYFADMAADMLHGIEKCPDAIEIGDRASSEQCMIDIMSDLAMLIFFRQMPFPHLDGLGIRAFEKLGKILEEIVDGNRTDRFKPFGIGDVEAQRFFLEKSVIVRLIFLFDRQHAFIAIGPKRLVEQQMLATMLHFLLDEDRQILVQLLIFGGKRGLRLQHHLYEIGFDIGRYSRCRVLHLRELSVRCPMCANLGKIPFGKAYLHRASPDLGGPV